MKLFGLGRKKDPNYEFPKKNEKDPNYEFPKIKKEEELFEEDLDKVTARLNDSENSFRFNPNEKRETPNIGRTDEHGFHR